MRRYNHTPGSDRRATVAFGVPFAAIASSDKAEKIKRRGGGGGFGAGYRQKPDAAGAGKVAHAQTLR